MIVFLKCLCTTRDKALAKQLRAQGYTIKVIRNSKQIRDEASQYNQTVPFVVENGKSRPL